MILRKSSLLQGLFNKKEIRRGGGGSSKSRRATGTNLAAIVQ
jgi:hypothetical protein